MAHDRIVLCLNCGQQNRLKPEGSVRVARCGSCSEPLAASPNGGGKAGLIPLLLVASVGVVGYLIYDDQLRWPNKGVESRQAAVEHGSSQQRGALSDAPAVPIPKLKPRPPLAISTGLVRTRPGRERIAPLELRTSSGANYFVKLYNIAEGREELAMYIDGGRTFTTEVPLGTYELSYCTGQVWYGEPYRFGPDLPCYRAEKQFTFYRQGSSVSGYTVELILQADGNLSTTRIDPSQF